MKILIIGPSWVGDMMMSHSLYRTLNALHPSARIDVMAPDWCRPLLERMPEITQALSMPIGHGRLALCDRKRLGTELRSVAYDRAYVLPNSFKSALVPFFAHIPQRVGWRGEMRYGLLNDIRRLNKAAFPRMVERYVALAYAASAIQSAADLPNIPTPSLQVSATEIEENQRGFEISLSRPVLGFCPGAEFGPAKRWPHYHFATLAHHLIKQGYQITLFGSAKDHAVGEQIRQALPEATQHDCLNLAGKTTLDQAVCLLAGCQAVVSNDSGLMHIAAALNKPLVAVYGPSSPDFTPPLSPQARVIRLISGYHKIRKGGAEEGYHQSLIDILPSLVLEQLQDLLPQVENR